ncbi:MAG: TetR/AcrR family transcriptional regulator [Pirellulaceae bacterium]|nr:TetR/AcrR family transcriptional regulator [Pirellulaceae bacterium]
MSHPPPKKRGTARKPDFLPLIADVFAECGYRRATTATLAKRCGVRENELYRIWPNKKSMFLDAIGFIFESVASSWAESIEQKTDITAAQQLIDSQLHHRGDSRLHRIIFSGLNEVDDPDICRALRDLYLNFHKMISDYVRKHRQQHQLQSSLSDDTISWMMIGIGSIFDIQQELGQGTLDQRRKQLGQAANATLNIR